MILAKRYIKPVLGVVSHITPVQKLKTSHLSAEWNEPSISNTMVVDMATEEEEENHDQLTGILEAMEQDSVLTDYSEVHDIPTMDERTLLSWLKCGQKKLEDLLKKKIPEACRPKQYKRRGLEMQSARSERRHEQEARMAAIDAAAIPPMARITRFFQSQPHGLVDQGEETGPPRASRPADPVGESVSGVGLALEMQVDTDTDSIRLDDDQSAPDLDDEDPSQLDEIDAILCSAEDKIDEGNDGLWDIPEVPFDVLQAALAVSELEERIQAAISATSESSRSIPLRSTATLASASTSHTQIRFEEPSRPSQAPPSAHQVQNGLLDLQLILKPPRKTGRGFKDARINTVLRSRLESMAMFLRLFRKFGYIQWSEASELAAEAAGKGPWLARRLREWTRAFLQDKKNLPVHQYGRWNASILADEDLAQEIHLHLQSKGKYVSAMDIVRFLDTPEMKERLDLSKPISERTAQRWMRVIGYRWRAEPKGQYKDGHEREDVVQYRQEVFLPRMEALEVRMRQWSNEDGTEKPWTGLDGGTPGCRERPVVLWCHDESIYYGNDRRKIRWVHVSESAVPWVKGEGSSIMIADFISADYGWLRSEDGCVLTNTKQGSIDSPIAAAD